MKRPSKNNSRCGLLSTALLAVMLVLIAAVPALFMTAPVVAAENDGPSLTTNQKWIENLKAGSKLTIANIDDAFEFVFSKLPGKVFVYPTENYYYYTFVANGVIYAGNLRLAAQDRDKGIIHFAAFRQANQASREGEIMYRPMTSKDGVKVEKLTPFSYRATYKEKSVVFQLNDVSAVTPPNDIVADGEKYLGLVADESGIRFFLFYNEKHKLFSYVLDETVDVLEQFAETEPGSRILVGMRTGFAFYNHHYLDRRVLIGVHGANTVVNNYFDGPADQLPENHIKDDNLRKAIEDSDESVKGLLDQFGYFNGGQGRYLITPYVQYLSTDELSVYNDCASDKSLPKETYDACFYAGDG